MIEFQKKIPRVNTFAGVLDRIKPLLSADDEDLQGLREWVAAKRIADVKVKDNDYLRYSSPWRIG